MNLFERKLQKQQEPDPVGAMEELKAGKFSITAEERERIIKQAKEQGRNPEEALREHEQRLKQATARVRVTQSEEAVGSLEHAVEEMLGGKEDKKGGRGNK